MTDLEQFAKTTIGVIQEDGLDGYLPTIMIPSKKEIRAIEGIPDDVDHREAIQTVILRSKLESTEFLFAVKTGPHEITTGHYTPNSVSCLTIVELDTGFVLEPVHSCAWWHIAP